MKFEVNEWGSFPEIGNGYAADIEGRWCSFLMTKKGAYRGDHTHPVDQYSVLLAGKAMIVEEVNGKLVEYPLMKDKIHTTRAGVPHITIPLEDIVEYEWWNGPFVPEPCPGIFDEYTKTRVGPP